MSLDRHVAAALCRHGINGMQRRICAAKNVWRFKDRYVITPGFEQERCRESATK
jgi:hypothetical protein